MFRGGFKVLLKEDSEEITHIISLKFPNLLKTERGPRKTLSVVELPRFELRITEPKSAVLPLHHSSIVARKRCKDNGKF